MGGICSKRSVVDKSPSDTAIYANCFTHHNPMVSETHIKVHRTVIVPPPGGIMEKRTLDEPISFSNKVSNSLYDLSLESENSIKTGEPKLSRTSSMKSRSTAGKPPASTKAGANKVSEVSSLLGKAVDVLDTLGSSMTSLNPSNGFVSGLPMKGNKISILAFEVANTIVKGANFMETLSNENIKHLKEVILPSEGVQNLISKDKNELLKIVALDKREELKVFVGEVVRFGNRCKDPQWHNLDRYFDTPPCEVSVRKQLQEEAGTIVEQLMTMVQYTSELYHELNALDRLEQDYRRKLLEEENSATVQRGDNIQILKQELKSQRKLVKNLKKKSLWSKILEEIMEMLVDIVNFLHVRIYDALESADDYKPIRIAFSSRQRLGPSGLALHYANIITQIENMVARSNLIPKNTRDTLYQSLPPAIKNSLRSKLQSFQVKEELTVPEIKDEMDRTLRWIGPLASNTTRGYQGFGWVGEWANTRIEVNQTSVGQVVPLRIETLHHADKEKTEARILNLVLYLHRLISQSNPRNRSNKSPQKSPLYSPSQMTSSILLSTTYNAQVNCSPATADTAALTPDDHDLLRVVNFQRMIPGISWSQEMDAGKPQMNNDSYRLTKSSSHSPASESKNEFFPSKSPLLAPAFSCDIDRRIALDMIDRVDTLEKLCKKNT